MSNVYDVCIVGTGPGGIFTALELIERNPNLKIIMLDNGRAITERERAGVGLTCGWAGAGGFSDGKVIVANPEHNYGGEIQKYIKDYNYFKSLSKRIVDIHLKFANGENIPVFGERNLAIDKFELDVSRNGMQLLLGQTLHIGTDRNFNIMKSMYDYLKDKINIVFECQVRDFVKNNDGFTVFTKNGSEKESEIECKYLVMMPGRSGNKWFEGVAKNHGITIIANRVDLGLRLEFPSWIMKEATDLIYEPKIITTTSNDTKVRTFCVNPRGFCVAEAIKDSNGDSVWTANGHSNSEHGAQSENTNMALLASAEFTKPFNQPNTYGLSVAKLVNLLAGIDDGGNGILVQRLKDLKENRRSNDKRITEIDIQPTLKATPGDLSYAYPAKQLNALVEAISILDRVFPGLDSRNTILYGPEIKWFSARIELNNRLESEIKNMYVGGDTGCSRGIMQAAMSGLVVANGIIEKIG